MSKKTVRFQDSAEFAAALSSLKASGAKSAEKKEVTGECSRLAMEVQANTAALYLYTRAHDKAHNPRADIVAGEIRKSMREAGIGTPSLNGACKDALAILRCEAFRGCKTGADFLAAFAENDLKSAGAVRNFAKGVKADPAATLAKQVAKLSEHERARFHALLAEAIAASGPSDVEASEGEEAAA